MFKIGLTGGIGSGKSTVCQMFQELGVYVIDADIISRTLVEPNKPVLQEIIATFGRQLLTADNKLDRRKLRERIFSNAHDQHKLEAILHPAIFAEIAEQVKNIHATYCIISIPLLLETNTLGIVNRILVIDISEKLQIERAAKRDNVEQNEILAIMHTQCSRRDRLVAADDIICNDGDINNLHKQALDLHNFYVRIASE